MHIAFLFLDWRDWKIADKDQLPLDKSIIGVGQLVLHQNIVTFVHHQKLGILGVHFHDKCIFLMLPNDPIFIQRMLNCHFLRQL